MGDKLEIFIPMRYQAKNLLIIEDKISALGIFSMRINDSIDCGLQIPAVIQIDPISTHLETINENQFFVCELHRGSRLITNLYVLQNEKLGYAVWLEFLSLGNMPSFINYHNAAFLFDDMKEITGKGIPVNHAVFEIIFAHVYRDAKDLNTFYRHTRMTEPPAQVTLRDVGHGPSSTHGRILGSYSEDGRNAALLNQSEHNSTLEDFFRA